MWKLIVEKHYKSTGGYDAVDKTDFRCDCIDEIGDIIQMFESHKLDKFEYHIVPVRKEEEENE